MKTVCLGSLILIVSMVSVHSCAITASAQSAQANVGGVWEMSVSHLSLHLVLSQDGSRITGTLESPHGDIGVVGEFVNGTLTFSGSTQDNSVHLSATATLGADGRLSGRLSTNMGDMTFTAARSQK